MRLSLLLLALLAIPLSQGSVDAAAGRIRWRDNVQAAALEARDTAKPMLIEFSTSWCGYCKKMRRETFANATVIDHVEGCFVPVTVDGDENRQLAKQMGVRSYPTTIIISPKMKVLARITGFRTPRELSVDLTKICAHDRTAARHHQQDLRTGARGSVFGGICPVSVAAEGELAKGNPAVSTTYRGFRLTFKTDSHRNEFLQHPERYWPIADGRCVVSALEQGQARLGAVKYGLAFRGRIWLFASQVHQDRFRQTPNEYYEKLVKLMENKSRTPGPNGPVRGEIDDTAQLSRDAR